MTLLPGGEERPVRSDPSPAEPMDGILLCEVLDAIPAAVLVLDKEGTVLQASRALSRLIGRRLSEALASNTRLDGLQAKEVLIALQEIAGTREAVRRVVRCHRPQPHYIQMWALPQPGLESSVQTLVFLLDVTHLLRTGDVGAEYVRHVRHNLSSPLTALKGGIELLLTERLGRLQGSQRKLLRIMEEGAESIVSIMLGDDEAEEEGQDFSSGNGRRG